MATQEDIEKFHRFALQRLTQATVPLSIDDLFELWRGEHPEPVDYAENLAALHAAINGYRQGDRGQPAGKLSQSLRAELDSPRST